jgi:heat-inducible transcriptional repressor
MSQLANLPINERAQHLLKVLVERYIRDGQPVGSRTLATETQLGLSPATIRNVLSDLEEHGYLASPHTSAGRIPTVRGYRFFVDSLLTVKPLDNNAVQQCQQQLKPDQNVPTLVSSASNLLSELTRLTGLVMLPRREHISLRQIEFLPLSDNRVLVILVLNEREVQNRIIYTKRIYSQNELQQAANYLNATYAGQEIARVRKKLLAAMQNDRATMDQLMRTAIEVADQVLETTPNEQDYVLAGQNHLFDLVDNTGIQGLRQLFTAFTQKHDILHLLDQCLNTNGVQIFIGEESGYDVLDECSVVTAPYSVEGQAVGVLGVIGPTRMPYERVISIVDVTAKLLSAALNQAT